MLFRIKIFIIILLIGVLTGGIIFLQKNKPQLPVEHHTNSLHLEKPAQDSGIKLERYSGSLNEKFSRADLPENLLAQNIQKCAANILQAVLPEKSIVLAPLEVELLKQETALVSCRAVIFPTDGKQEEMIQCKVRVNYLPSGSCEAEYPEFFSAK